MVHRKTPKHARKKNRKRSAGNGARKAKKRKPRPRQNSRRITPKKSTKKSRGKPSPKKTHTVQKPPSLSRLFWDFRQALAEAEQVSYFDLDRDAQNIFKPFQDSRTGLPQIKAWTFTVHPSVRNSSFATGNLKRYIVAIDTRMSSIYFGVKKYLESLVTNVTTFYSGGWADFLCDVQLNPVNFKRFIDDLKTVLIESGLKRIERDVDSVISIFEVNETIVLCGKPIGSFVKPPESAFDLIREDPVKFDTVHENYRSHRARSLFKNANELRNYLARLKGEGIIVCYKVVFDFSYWISRDYVPMILGEKRGAEIAMENLLVQAKSQPELLAPVEELLQIEDVESSDSAEKEVKYFFINSYEYPGARDEWKRTIYQAANVDVNIYNYPLEGALNERPTYLSDLPQLLDRSREYEVHEDALTIGEAHHDLIPDRPLTISLSKNGLARHGITLGESGSGKTTTDIVLAVAAQKVMSTVIVLDASGAIDGKKEALPSAVSQRLRAVSVTSETTKDEFMKATAAGGLYVFETTKQDVAEVFSELVKAIETLDDAAKGLQAREVKNLLLIEEAGQVLRQSGQPKENTEHLIQFLDEAYRKGWSLWFSAQHPSSIGATREAQILLLKTLRNRIIHSQTDEVDRLLEVFGNEKRFSAEDADYLSSVVGDLQTGEALVRGIDFRPTEHNLPLIKIKAFNLERLD